MEVGLHLHEKYPLFLSEFNKTSIFSTDFQKNTQIPNLMKILAVKTELIHAGRRTNVQREGQTEVTKLTVIFRNFAHAPKKYLMRIS